MSTAAFSSLVPPSNPEISDTSNFDRQSADFHPCLWKDFFIQYASDSLEVDDDMKEYIEKLKEEVRKMLVPTTEKAFMKAELIDSIQCLGLTYHFEAEIDEVLKQIHNDCINENNEIITHIEDLHSLALLFKLLRQHGYPVSSDVFNKFKDEEGNFNKTLTSDVEGMINLYEASHLSIHGEDILDEAFGFTSNHLKSITIESNPFLAAKLNHVLDQCPYMGIPRLEARKYISIYHLHPSHDEVLLTLAKLDFNAVQKLHKIEIGNICKRWNSLDLLRNLSYVRNRVVESYFWAIAVYFEPQYFKARSILTYIICTLTIVDDTYDVYGTIDELELFTAAIERWNGNCLDDLPGYMKLIYKQILNIFEEIDDEDKGKEGRSCNSVDYMLKQFKRIVQAYMTESRWLCTNYIPTSEEYLNISIITTCHTLLSMTSFICMGDIVTEDIFKWAETQPKIIEVASVISRLENDIASREFELKKENMISFVECYMKDHGMSKLEAIEEVRKMIKSAWKDINEECLKPTQVPMPFLMRVLNLPRCMNVTYKNGDSFTNSKGIMKKHIIQSFVDPVPI